MEKKKDKEPERDYEGVTVYLDKDFIPFLRHQAEGLRRSMSNLIAWTVYEAFNWRDGKGQTKPIPKENDR